MKRELSIALVWLAFAGCAHTKTTDDGTEKKEEQKKEEPKAERQNTKPERSSARGSRGSDIDPGERDAVPIATAPEALLAPGADDRIRERLVAGGYLAGDAKPSDTATREGLRRFQRAQDLPATGVADHETVKRLGLDPDRTFRRGTVKD